MHRPVGDGLFYLRHHFEQVALYSVTLESCLHQATVIAVVVAISQHQAIGKYAADNHDPGLFVGKYLVGIHQGEAVGIGAKQMNKRHGANLAHHSIAVACLQLLCVFQGIVILPPHHLPVSQKINPDGLQLLFFLAVYCHVRHVGYLLVIPVRVRSSVVFDTNTHSGTFLERGRYRADWYEVYLCAKQGVCITTGSDSLFNIIYIIRSCV